MDDPVELYRKGTISAEVALARLVLSGVHPDEVRARADAAQTPVLAETARTRYDAMVMLRNLVEGCGVDHVATNSLEQIRDLFDRAVAVSPEASVAAYTLGDSRLLDVATEELVAWLEREDLIRPEIGVLDLGCGIGRVAAALAPRVRSVLGLDISPGMIAEARRRYGGHERLRFETAPGERLDFLLTDAFDLVLAVDSFPYLTQAGIAAELHVADVARVLRPRGALAIFNLSYGGLAGDCDRAESWAAKYGFTLDRRGERPLQLWDAAAFLFRRADA